MNGNKLTAIIIAIACIFGLPWIASECWEHLDADQVMVVQSPVSGKLTWYTDPGVKWQGFGTVTKYHRRQQFWFSSKKDQGKPHDESIKVRFNDGGHANISGSLSWEMPLDETHLTLIHTRYHSEEALEHQVIRTNLEKAVYMTGPLMSSADSYAARRNDLLGLIEDQFLLGVYKTSSRDERTTDPLTNTARTIKVVEPVKDDKTKEILREEQSPLIALGITASNISINEVKYDDKVEEQIQEQQKSIMAVQTSIAETKTAEQKKLTTIAKGEADAAEAEWKQKVITAQATAEAEQKKQVAVTEAEQKRQVATTEAQQKLEVAQLETQAAEQKKLGEILLGEGEAMRRKLVMDADGSLQQKLEAYVTINERYAQAFGNYAGSWVPSIVFGGNNTNGTSSTATTGGLNGMNDLISMMMVSTAKQLGIDAAIPNKSGTLPDIKRPEASKFKFQETKPFKFTNPVVPPVTQTTGSR